MAMENNLPNQEIIDATQDAVLNAVGSVANVIETTAHEISGHGAEPFYQSAEFWVAVSFILAVIALMRPVVKIARTMLRKRRNLIAKRIEDASNVHAEAQKMLAEYEKKYRKAKSEANEILNRAEREIALLKKEKLSKLENDMANREREAKARIATTQDRDTEIFTMERVWYFAPSIFFAFLGIAFGTTTPVPFTKYSGIFTSSPFESFSKSINNCSRLKLSGESTSNPDANKLSKEPCSFIKPDMSLK